MNGSSVRWITSLLLASELTSLSQVEFDPGCEAMIYTVDGHPLQGTHFRFCISWILT